jgi:hypothetical protein
MDLNTVKDIKENREKAALEQLKESITEAIDVWFRTFYELPAESTPVDEGEFHFLSGPFHPQDILVNGTKLAEGLTDIFDQIFLDRLVGKYVEESYEWAGIIQNEDTIFGKE